MNSRSRLVDRDLDARTYDELSPQERLQRLADAFDAEPALAERMVQESLEAEEHRAARLPPETGDLAEPRHEPLAAYPRAEAAPAGAGWLAGVARFLLIMAVATAVGGVLLTLFGPVPPGAVPTGPVPPAAQSGTGSK